MTGKQMVVCGHRATRSNNNDEVYDVDRGMGCRKGTGRGRGNRSGRGNGRGFRGNY